MQTICYAVYVNRHSRFFIPKGVMTMHMVLSPDTTASPYQEGDLFKKLDVHGHSFDIYYGYYEDCERENPTVAPMPIYPDFLKEPKHTASGAPFVTKMQDACEHYRGKHTSFKECAECVFYSHGDEFIGICTCPENRISE